LKFIEQRLAQRKAKLKAKLPEITKSYHSVVQMEASAVSVEPSRSAEGDDGRNPCGTTHLILTFAAAAHAARTWESHS
jgi:hypothetical protein